MTAIGVTDRAGGYNQSTQAHDWKRRSERLVRASGHPYTIVRPGWFDDNTPDQHQLIFLQGDTRHAGNSSDGVVARRQIAQVVINSLTSAAAVATTVELVAEHGPAQTDLDPLFAQLDKDLHGSLDGVRDAANMPVDLEPERVLDDLRQLRTPPVALHGTARQGFIDSLPQGGLSDGGCAGRRPGAAPRVGSGLSTAVRGCCRS